MKNPTKLQEPKIQEPKKQGINAGNILVLFCVVVLICVCVLVPVLVVRYINSDFKGLPEDDIEFLSKLKEMYPTSGVIHTCEYLEDVLADDLSMKTQQNVNHRVSGTVLRNKVMEIKSRHCNDSTLECDANARFRTIDGSCNNLKYPRRGMVSQPQARYLPPVYAGNTDLPRLSVNGQPLPNSRLVSNYVFRPKNLPTVDTNSTLTVMHMSFGQFFDHDIGLTPVHTEEDGSDINCCLSANENRAECSMKIDVEVDDPELPLFPDRQCMNFVRSLPAMTDMLKGYRNQVNKVTSYVDASNVYGSTMEKSDMLRSKVGGELVVDQYDRLPEGSTKCFKDEVTDFCQDAGDKRVNVVPNLSAVHLLWVREHNRIANELASLNPNCKDDELFFETRKIIIAMMQHIVYNEYIPPILNSGYMEGYELALATNGYATGYNQSYDATMSNVFSVAAFRFGHSQITNTQAQFSESHHKMKEVVIEQTYHRPHFSLEGNGTGYEGVLRWLINDPALKADRFFESGVRNKLFPDPRNKTSDLPAVNTQRGRDHGIPPYNSWREWCSLPRAKNFKSYPGGLSDHTPEAAAALDRLYSHPDDIDLYPGAMSEEHIPGGIVGPTFACILGFQFNQLKHGDRFWYEKDNGNVGLTRNQLEAVRNITLSRIICDNIPITEIQRLAFHTVSPINPRMRCEDLPFMDLTKWQPLSCTGN